MGEDTASACEVAGTALTGVARTLDAKCGAHRKPTRAAAMLAKCHECCGYYVDGKVDCAVPTCPLYRWMPYRTSAPDLAWLGLRSRRQGRVAR